MKLAKKKIVSMKWITEITRKTAVTNGRLVDNYSVSGSLSERKMRIIKFKK